MEERLTAMQVDYVNIDFLNEEGLLLPKQGCRESGGISQSAEGGRYIHRSCELHGCEEAVARLASMVRKPVLLWAVRDDAPEPEATVSVTPVRGVRQQQVLSRFDIPFTLFDQLLYRGCEIQETVSRISWQQVCRRSTRPGSDRSA